VSRIGSESPQHLRRRTRHTSVSRTDGPRWATTRYGSGQHSRQGDAPPQGKVEGKLAALGFEQRLELAAEAWSEEAVATAAIEGERLDRVLRPAGAGPAGWAMWPTGWLGSFSRSRPRAKKPTDARLNATRFNAGRQSLQQLRFLEVPGNGWHRSGHSDPQTGGKVVEQSLRPNCSFYQSYGLRNKNKQPFIPSMAPSVQFDRPRFAKLRYARPTPAARPDVL